MDAFKISAKLLAAQDNFPHDAFVPVFHRWIQEQLIPGHLLIDVADYAHVPNGPGTVLIAHEANFHMDRSEGRLGIMYVRKTALPGAFADRLRAVLTETFSAATRLEQEPSLAGKLRFKTDEIVIRFHDRLLAPSTPETFDAIKPDLQKIAKLIYPNAPFTIEPHIDPRKLLEARIKSSLSAPISDLLHRLESAPAAAR